MPEDATGADHGGGYIGQRRKRFEDVGLLDGVGAEMSAASPTGADPAES
ncbi:MAG TPA: hypothetical protein VFN78_13985 [Ktedonobacterales bacterium]|nr:hypothetical protein [Ktedonobacterales bacterium]